MILRPPAPDATIRDCRKEIFRGETHCTSVYFSQATTGGVPNVCPVPNMSFPLGRLGKFSYPDHDVMAVDFVAVRLLQQPDGACDYCTTSKEERERISRWRRDHVVDVPLPTGLRRSRRDTADLTDLIVVRGTKSRRHGRDSGQRRRPPVLLRHVPAQMRVREN